MLFSQISDIVNQLNGKFEHIHHETGQNEMLTNRFSILQKSKVVENP